MQVHRNAAANEKQRLDVMGSDLGCRQIAARNARSSSDTPLGYGFRDTPLLYADGAQSA